MTSGSVADSQWSGRPATSRSDENINVVRELFRNSPEASIRRVSRDTGLPSTTVFKILHKDLNFKPWKPHLCQDLVEEDFDRRKEYGETMLAWHEDWPELFHNILWSDEATFHVGGFVNRHNCHYWAKSDPKVTMKKSQSRPRLTVWCGMTSEQVTGPFVMRDTMNGERYLNMLQEKVWPIVSSWDNSDRLIFMQDGAPPHFSRDVQEWLNNNFTGRWIGRRGAIDWPARSPDLTPCDFFLWGWAKEQVYKENPQTIDELEASVNQVLKNVPLDFLRHTIENVPKRLQKLVEEEGGYVEL